DGSGLALVSHDQPIRIWNPTTDSYISELKGHRGRVTLTVWSQDGIRVWDPNTGDCISVLKEHTDLVQSIAWSQDGSGLASSANDKTIKIWDLETENCSSTPEELTSEDGTVKIRDLATEQCIPTISGHRDLEHGDRRDRLQQENLDPWHTATGSFELEPSESNATSPSPSVPTTP
ncbi:uncharacterized protein N7529_001159, partial [Penicillium soppii]|uniref:uncharacterized protein n=1 Tax=Penicillium soppii TaxID=69789 RepID=UPI0025478EA2